MYDLQSGQLGLDVHVQGLLGFLWSRKSHLVPGGPMVISLGCCMY